MRCDITEYFNLRFASSDSVNKLSLIESCYDILDEGYYDTRIISTANAHTFSLVYEILDNVKEALLRFIEKILKSISNFYLNYVKPFSRHRDLLLTKFKNIKNPIVYEYHEYPDKYNKYPFIVHRNTIENKIVKLQEGILNGTISPEDVPENTDEIIADFAKDVTDGNIDPQNVAESTKNIVTKLYKGNKRVLTLTESTLVKFCDNVNNYKRDRDEIIAARKDIIKEYEMLKDQYNKYTNKPLELRDSQLARYTDPEKAQFHAHEFVRFSDVSLEMTRMFNSFISIYQTAFDTKLNLFQEKIDHERDIIVEVLTQTGVFAILNTRDNTNISDRVVNYNPRWVD